MYSTFFGTEFLITRLVGSNSGPFKRVKYVQDQTELLLNKTYDIDLTRQTWLVCSFREASVLGDHILG